MARIFIAYSRQDKNTVRMLIPLIERFTTHDAADNKEQDTIWYDPAIEGGSEWWQMILREIAQADVFLYMLSDDALRAPYCIAECREAMRLDKAIIPVLVRPVHDYPASAPRAIQPALTSARSVDLSSVMSDSANIQATFQALNALIQAGAQRQPAPPEEPTPIAEPYVNDLDEDPPSLVRRPERRPDIPAPTVPQPAPIVEEPAPHSKGGRGRLIFVLVVGLVVALVVLFLIATQLPGN